jgi:hypothetical protein
VINLCTAHWVNVSSKVLTNIRLPEKFYCVCNVDTRHPKLYYVTTVDYL